MSEAEFVAAILWLALTAYAVLAGADFGGGVWDLLATGPRAREQRRAVAEAMGPVWEANHVWLIFMIVGLFTAFPMAFGIVSLALYVPFTIALIGIVLRGAAFAFRAHGREAVGDVSAWGVAFGAASVVAPFFLATAVAAVASGSILVAGDRLVSDFTAGWTTPFALALGLFAVAMCAYLAATYLMVETEGTPLEADFRRRALAAGVVSGVLALVSIAVALPAIATDFLAGESGRALVVALFGRGLPLLAIALINGPIALAAVWFSRPRIARVAVAAQVVFVLWAWVVGFWGYLIYPDVTVNAAAAPSSTLTALLIVTAIGMVFLLPSLYLLFRVFKSRNPAAAIPPT
jgi:cytochrome d ubiquinol oxidase subunit II